MTSPSERIDIPEQVHRSDFAISLATAVHKPDRTISDHVVTPQLPQRLGPDAGLTT